MLACHRGAHPGAQRRTGRSGLRSDRPGPTGCDRSASGPTADVDALDLLDEMQQAFPPRPIDPGVRRLRRAGALHVGHDRRAQGGRAQPGQLRAIAVNILANLVSPERDSVMLHAASLVHASGTFVLPYWVRGGCAAVLPGFDPGGYLDQVARYRATEINLVPTMLGMLGRLRRRRTGRPLDPACRRLRGEPDAPTGGQAGAGAVGPPAPCSTTGRPRRRCASRCSTGTTTSTRAAGQLRVPCRGRRGGGDRRGRHAGRHRRGRRAAVRAPFAMRGYADAPELTARDRHRGRAGCAPATWPASTTAAT